MRRAVGSTGTGDPSGEELSSLERQGYLHLRSVLTPHELTQMREAWDGLLEAGRRLKSSGSEAPNDGPTGLEQAPAFACCLKHPRVMSVVSALLGGDVVLIGMRGRDPPQGHGRQGLHADLPQPVEPARQVMANVFWVLDDMDGANGATRLVPGSHRLRQLPRGQWAQAHGHHPQELTVAAQAGDAIVFSAHVWHAGSLNSSGARRRVAIAQFGRSELVVSGSRLPEEMLTRHARTAGAQGPSNHDRKDTT
jgi:hypothetical protein